MSYDRGTLLKDKEMTEEEKIRILQKKDDKITYQGDGQIFVFSNNRNGEVQRYKEILPRNFLKILDLKIEGNYNPKYYFDYTLILQSILLNKNAKSIFSKLIRFNDNFSVTNILYSKLLLRMKKEKLARKQIEKANENNEFLQLSFDEIKKNDEKRLNYKIKEYEILNNQGVILTKLGLGNKALDYFQESYSLNSNILSLYNWALALESIEDVDKAIEKYEMCIKLDNSFIKAYNNIAILYIKKGEYQKAYDSIKNGISLEYNYHKLHYNKAVLFYLTSNFDKSHEAINESIKIYEENPISYTNYAYYTKALILRKLEIYESAYKNYTKATTNNPFSSLLFSDFGILLYEMNKYDEAIDKFNKALELTRDNKEALNYLGLIYYENNEYEESEICFKRVFKIDPTFAEAYSNYGDLLSDLKRFDESIKMYKKAIKINNKSQVFYSNIVVTLIETKKFKEALKFINISLGLFPDNEEMLELREVVKKIYT